MKVVVAGPMDLRVLKESLDLPALGARGHGSPVVAELGLALRARGHEVVLVTMDADLSTEKRTVTDGLTVRVGPYRPHGRARDLFQAERRYLTAAMRAEDADVVHAHWSYEYAAAAISSRRPHLVTVRDWAPTGLWLKPQAYRAVRTAMHAYVLLRAASLSVTSPIMRDRVRRWTRRDAPIIPNAVPDWIFAPFGRSLEGARLVSVNNALDFNARKNVGTLLEAFDVIRRSAPEAQLQLIGTGSDENAPVARWARARRLHQNVEFLGPRSYREVVELLRRADVLVHPSREESFGLVLVEAMAQGTPVVGGSRSGAVPWVLDEGAAGRLCNIDSARAISDAVLSLLRDGEQWRNLSIRGRQRAEFFRYDAVIDRYEEEYRRASSALRQSGAEGSCATARPGESPRG